MIVNSIFYEETYGYKKRQIEYVSVRMPGISAGASTKTEGSLDDGNRIETPHTVKTNKHTNKISTEDSFQNLILEVKNLKYIGKQKIKYIFTFPGTECTI